MTVSHHRMATSATGSGGTSPHGKFTSGGPHPRRRHTRLPRATTHLKVDDMEVAVVFLAAAVVVARCCRLPTHRLPHSRDVRCSGNLLRRVNVLLVRPPGKWSSLHGKVPHGPLVRARTVFAPNVCGSPSATERGRGCGAVYRTANRKTQPPAHRVCVCALVGCSRGVAWMQARRPARSQKMCQWTLCRGRRPGGWSVPLPAPGFAVSQHRTKCVVASFVPWPCLVRHSRVRPGRWVLVRELRAGVTAM